MLGPIRREKMGKIFDENEQLTFAEMRTKMFPGAGGAPPSESKL
jgi:hypothetical protein